MGIDIGFGFVKATDGQQKYLFPSVVGEAREIRYKTGLNTNSILDNLIVEVDNDKYFVGDLAIRQSDLIQSTISDKRINSIENKVLFLTAFALLDGVGTGVSKFNLVTGLPVDEYIEYKDTLMKQLQSDHVVKLSSSSTTALSTAYKLINRKLKEHYDINKPLHQLDGIIRNESFTYNGKEIDIADLIDKAFSLTAENIISEINTLWPEIWEMDKIFITGGGGLALGKYFKPYLENYTIISEGQFSNVEGYKKVANRSFRPVSV